MAGTRFTFIGGSDDYVVGKIGKERFDALSAAADEFSREIVNGFASGSSEVESLVNRFRDAVQTIGLFGGRRYVWLKDVNFLADSVTGRAETTLGQVESLRQILAALDPEYACVLITASPVDRRRSFLKWVEANGDCLLAGGDAGDEIVLRELALTEAKTLGVQLTDGALAVLVAKIGGNARLLVEEVRKLANYVGAEGGTIEEAHVSELVANFAEGEFYEAAEAFFAGNLRWTLEAFHRHFFAGGNARPVLTALQNRNRLLMQVKMLIESGDLRLGPGGIDKASFANAQQKFAQVYGENPEKSSCNVFTQNLWYLGKLATNSKLPSLRRLIDTQQEFYATFRQLLDRPNEEEEVLRGLAVRCLS